MHKNTINEIETALRLHCNYNGNFSGGYLEIMDRLAAGFSGSKSQKVCKLLDLYFREVNVLSLDEALERLRNKDSENANNIKDV